jgi:putative transposase
MAQMTLEKMDKPERANESTWRRWLKDYKKFNAGIICLAREGMKAYQDKYAPYITRDPDLLDVGQCLVADGKVLNFNILHPVTGRPCRMILIVFFDWKSRYPCGWHIMPSENQLGILTAFRNAVIALGKYPESVYLDNGRAFKSKLFTKIDPDFEELTGIYARVGTAVFFAKPYNGRSKVVERFFLTFQSQLEWLMPSFCGDSIQTKPAHMHRNEKWHKAMHEARTKGWVPTIREASMIIDRYFQWYADQPHSDLPSCPADMFLENRGPGVDPVQLNYDFLLRIKVRPRRCRITLWKIEYESDSLHNLDTDLTIYAAVNTADLRIVWCYTLDGIYLGEAYPVKACHPLAKLFGDQVALDQVIEANKRQARMARANKQQLERLGISANAENSANILPFNPKVPILQDAQAVEDDSKAQEPEIISDKEILQLEAAVEKAESDMAVEPEIPRPKYWQSDLEHYEWVFRLIHEHGRSAGAEDAAFMAEFEAQPDFNSYRQRFEDLKLLFNL